MAIERAIDRGRYHWRRRGLSRSSPIARCPIAWLAVERPLACRSPRHHWHRRDSVLRRAVDQLVADSEVDQRVPLGVNGAVDVGALEKDRGAGGIDLLAILQGCEINGDRPDLAAGNRKPRGIFC